MICWVIEGIPKISLNSITSWNYILLFIIYFCLLGVFSIGLIFYNLFNLLTNDWGYKDHLAEALVFNK